MQVELQIDETLARYAKTLGAKLVKRAFEEAFARMMSSANQPRALSQADAQMLDAAGLGEPADATVAVAAAGESAAEQAALFATALTVEQTGQRLGLNASRIRQQIAARELYAMRDGRQWRLPQFQFLADGGELRRLPNSGPVFQSLPPDLAAIAVARWFAAPNDELQAPGAETALSPKDWLAQGHSAEPVARLAAELAGEPQGEPPAAAGAAPLVEELSEGIAALQEAGDERALRALSRTLQRVRQKHTTGGG